MQKEYQLAVDIEKKILTPSFEVNTLDLKTIKLKITITKGMTLVDLTDITVRMSIRKPDGNVIFQDCQVTNAKGGQVEIILENQAYVMPGSYSAEIMCFKGSDKVAVTGSFSYRSIRGIMDDKAIESKSEFTAITGMIKDTQETIEDLRNNGTGIDSQARQDVKQVTLRVADTMNVNLNDPKYNLKGDGTDETLKIRQAFEDAMTKGKPIDLGVASSKYTITESIVIDRPLTIYANGEKSIFEQLSWGVPCLEIRSPNVSIIGNFITECNAPRTRSTSATVAASKNNSMVKKECANDSSSPGAGIYLRGPYDNLYIDKLSAKGYICGISLMGHSNFNTLPRNLNINVLNVENVDFGLLGTGYNGFNINTVIGKNILRSQGVDEHVLYFTQSNVYNESLNIGSVYVEGVETATSHALSIKTVKNFNIGRIHCENVGAFVALQRVRGNIGIIQGKANKQNKVSACVYISEENTDCIINSLDIECSASYDSASVRGYGVMVGASAKASVNNLKLKMIDTAPSIAVYLNTLESVEVNNPIIEYTTPPVAEVYALLIESTVKKANITNPVLKGHNKLYYKKASAVSKLIVNPNLNPIDSNSSIMSVDGNENTAFSELAKTPFVITANSDVQPVIRAHNVIKFSKTVANSINKLRFGTNGQEILLLNGDNLTGITHGADIVLKGGTNLSGTEWKAIKLVYYDGVAYQL